MTAPTQPGLPCPADVEELEELLSRPPERLIESIQGLDGDILFLGVGGKMGPTMARMAHRACNSTARLIASSASHDSRIPASASGSSRWGSRQWLPTCWIPIRWKDFLTRLTWYRCPVSSSACASIPSWLGPPTATFPPCSAAVTPAAESSLFRPEMFTDGHRRPAADRSKPIGLPRSASTP